MTGMKFVAAAPIRRAGVLLMLALVAGCSTRQPLPPVAVIRPTPVTPIAPAAPDRLVPDAVAASANVIWALRGGLNVAALLCKARSITTDYNQMLKVHRSILDEAYASEQARYRQRFGSAGQARHDVAMTRLYNGFASVPDRVRYCTMAARIAAEVVALPSADLPRIAARALTTLEPGAMRLVNSAP